MTNLTLNIGLNVGDSVPPGQLGRTIAALAHAFDPLFLRTELQSSATEQTLVVELGTDALTIPARVFSLCEELDQDAIAYTVNGYGLLTGPKSANWGDSFDSSLFLSPSWSK